MATTVKVRAQAIVDIVGGMSVRRTAKKHGIAASTLGEWMAVIKAANTAAPVERKTNAYHAALEKFALAAFDMLNAQAELLADPEYIRKQTTSDVISHTRFIHERLIKHIELERAIQSAQSALPERTEAIEPEIMEEVA